VAAMVGSAAPGGGGDAVAHVTADPHEGERPVNTMAVRSRAFDALWASAVVLVAGCDPRGQTFDYPVARVEGRVTCRGEPVRGGWVEFHPQPPTVGHVSTAKIGRDGSYQARRVAVGMHRVQIVRTRPLLPPPYRSGHSTLRARVVVGRTNAIDFLVADGTATTRARTQPGVRPGPGTPPHPAQGP